MKACEIVTNYIINELSNGTIPWQKPWTSAHRACNWQSGHTYSLLNQWLLGTSGEWATFNQIAAAGGRINKGAHAHTIVYYTNIPVGDPEDPDYIPYLKYIGVFNIEADCTGLAPKHITAHSHTHNATADAIIASYLERTGVTLSDAMSNQAYYSPADDSVVVPARYQYANSNEYYSTLFHELAHSTGTAKRLDRHRGNTHFGSCDYSFEELVAEIASATLMATLGIEDTFRNTAAYCQNWLKVLQNDKRLIIKAAGCAEKAVELILGGAF